MAAGFRPPHLKDEDFDEVRTVEEGEAREMARRLAKEEGIFAGTSSGLNVVAALKLAQELGAEARWRPWLWTKGSSIWRGICTESREERRQGSDAISI